MIIIVLIIRLVVERTVKIFHFSYDWYICPVISAAPAAQYCFATCVNTHFVTTASKFYAYYV
jgi:hypothetical protein